MNTKKTTIDWLKEGDPEWRDKALANYIRKFNTLPEKSQRQELRSYDSRLSTVLLLAFPWSTTPEGRDYWATIKLGLEADGR